MRIIRSSRWDPFWNLAVEEYLLDCVERYHRILFLWQSENAVVVGKNQNPWRECRIERVAAHNADIARRVTGGGAVYQDRGNLNFAYYCPRTEYREARPYAAVCAALSELGIHAQRMGKNSLHVQGKKISGNAFCFRRNSALHHGTLLVRADLQKLRAFLQPPDYRLSTRAIGSVPATVANLARFSPHLTVPEVESVLTRAFARDAGSREVTPTPASQLPADPIDRLYRKHRSWTWRFGQSPPFSIELEAVFDWGSVVLALRVEQGYITDINIRSDGLDGADIGHLEGELLDAPFKSSAMARRIRGGIGPEGHALRGDIASWIEARRF